MKKTSKIFTLAAIVLGCWWTFKITKNILKNLEEFNDIDFS